MNKLLDGLSEYEQDLAQQIGNHLAYYALQGSPPPGGMGAFLNQVPERIRKRFAKLVQVLDVMNSGGQAMREGPFGSRVTRAELAKEVDIDEKVLEAAFDVFNTERMTSKLMGRLGTDASGGLNEQQLARRLQANPNLTSADVQKPMGPPSRRDAVSAAMRMYDQK